MAKVLLMFIVAAATLVALAGCATPTSTPPTAPPIAITNAAGVAADLDYMSGMMIRFGSNTIVDPVRFSNIVWQTDFRFHTVPYEDIWSGGLGKDDVPTLDDPMFEPVTAADARLHPLEPVIALEFDNVAKAYPLRILTWHEIVNDSIASVPITVTFCPLCNSALAFIRRLDGTVYEFAVSGNLRNSDLIMRDRQTQSWWQQFTGESIAGTNAGKRLTVLPAAIVSWEDFREAHPDGQVLTEQTGHDLPYGTTPYAGYDRADKQPRLYDGEDERLLPKERVAAASIAGEHIAYPYSVLQQERVVNDEINAQPFAVFYQAGTLSVLDSSKIVDSRPVGTTALFSRTHGERPLTFVFNAELSAFMDIETQSTWDIFGTAQSGPLQGQRLTRLIHQDHFWFAWAAFHPDTTVYRGAGT
jgi:hypothetical protein